MSSIKLESNASGTGIFTIASPNSNTNRTLTLPDATGTIITTAGGAAISGTTGTFTGLVDISAAGAGQIQFPATQNASSNANTLDDYEEGSWTPALSFSTSGSVSYSNQSGSYSKIGNTVTIRGIITLSATSSPTGEVGITGLPFSAATNNSVNFGIVRNLASAGIVLRGYTDAGTTCTLSKNATNAGHSSLAGSDLTSTTLLQFNISYFV